MEDASKFENKWQFSHCMGATDGKHIGVKVWPETCSHYFNYKGFHSIALIAIARPDYEYFMADISCYGRVSDEGVINGIELYTCLVNKQLYLPKLTQFKILLKS